jgi:hypothetical protein
MFASTFSSAFLHPLEYVKWLFAVLYVVSTIGITVGVYWEGEQFPKVKQERGWRLLIWSLAFDTLFTILIFGTDGWISQIQQREIIALQTRLAARTLSDAQAVEIKKRVESFADQTFQIIPYWQNKESLAIANRIAAILSNAHWKLHNPEQFTTLLGVTTGVFVSVDKGASESSRRAAKELTSALNENEIEANEEEGDNPNPSDEIHMSVGIKP